MPNICNIQCTNIVSNICNSLLTSLTKTNLVQPNVTISATHLIITTHCPTCREAGNGDDPCVTLLSPCTICSSFTDEQLAKITHRKRYSKKSDKNKAEDIDSELLGDNSSESYGGSHAELEVAANRLFTSPPRPQPLSFEALSLRTPACTVPPTPGTALQQKVRANLEKSLSSRLDIQMDQKMGTFQASMLEAFFRNLYKSKGR